ncbi:MAG: xanthine dehydrogenase family protein molybdopterin-binding subunit [Xanthomonadales bacterium]|nr:xanthine dehydrogenase family protein molybdopterin-binding subunit [Xanthomonadales bacterium]
MSLSRRRLLQTGGALLIGFVAGPLHRHARAQDAAATVAVDPNAFLRIDADGLVSVLLSHCEMGQGIWTALPMLIAEELECDWSAIRVAHAPVAPAYNHTGWGIQGTGGSSSVLSEFDRYRRVGAMARQLLLQAAAAHFGVAESTCRAKSGRVHAGSRSIGFGELAAAAAKLPAPTEVTLKPRSAWRLLGQPTARLDSPEKTDGTALFGIDAQVEGLSVALLARPPSFGATLKRVDDSAAKAVSGVHSVHRIGEAVAVVAAHFWAARQGRDALLLEWDESAGSELTSTELWQRYRELAGSAGATVVSEGDADAALSEPEGLLQADYEVPYLAHAAMEPLNCTVRIDDSGCDVWTGTQFQTLDQAAVAKLTGLPVAKVRIHTLFLGGGFGRRANPASDFIAQAVQVAQVAKRPVKLIWTREDDMRGGYYRPMFLHRLRARLDDVGQPAAFSDVIVGQSILRGTAFAAMVRDGIDHSSVEGVSDSPYLAAIPKRHVSMHSPELGVPVLWWRSVGHTHTAFAMECFIDEMAAKAGQDPLLYRRELLGQAKAERMLGVLDRVASEFGWDRALPEGRGKGLAVHHSFGSYVAQAAEVSVRGRRVQVHRVHCAIDCGIYINPLTIEAQVQSAIAFGLSAALHQALELREGRVAQSNFHDFPCLRMDEMPQVHVHLVDSGQPPGGVGEPATPTIAPAVANAVFHATGKRLRSLPLRA